MKTWKHPMIRPAAVGLLALSVLSFYGSSGAAPQKAQLPFANPVEQNNEIIRELREIRAAVQEQTAVLRELSGKMSSPHVGTKRDAKP
jgi:hypothetical protein